MTQQSTSKLNKMSYGYLRMGHQHLFQIEEFFFNDNILWKIINQCYKLDYVPKFNKSN